MLADLSIVFSRLKYLQIHTCTVYICTYRSHHTLTAATYRGSLVTESNFVDFCRQRRLTLKPILWLMPHLLRKFWILFNKLHTTNSWRKGQMKVCIAASVSLITAKSLSLMNYHIFSNIQYNFSIINRHFVPKLHSFSDVKTSSFCILGFFGFANNMKSTLVITSKTVYKVSPV